VVGRARRETLTDGTVVLRTRWGGLATAGYPLLLPVAFLVALNMSRGPYHPADDFLLFMGLLFVLESLVLLATSLRRRVVLGADTITLRGAFRSQTFAAADIQAVTLSGTRGPVQVWTTDRHPYPCPALMAVDLPTVGDWWLATRGPDWRPAWPVAGAVLAPIAWWA
jgi:Bacterial PH domain